MEITDIRLSKVAREGKMKAIASITLDNEFAVHDIKVIEGEKGLFIAMPSRKAADGDYRDIVHPINQNARNKIQTMILDEYSKMIAEEEQLGAKQREIVEAAALVHDIGIHAAEKKYRSAAGEYQEIEGPPIARAMLMALDFSPALINRVCDMVAHHHSYDKIDEVDLQILIEADFMVNAYEDGLPKRNIKSFRDKIFRTETGIHYLNELFALEN